MYGTLYSSGYEAKYSGTMPVKTCRPPYAFRVQTYSGFLHRPSCSQRIKANSQLADLSYDHSLLLSSYSELDILWRKPSHRVTYSMVCASASRKSPNDAPWEKLSETLSRPISASLLTLARTPAGYLHHSWHWPGYLHHSWQLFCTGYTKKENSLFHDFAYPYVGGEKLRK